MTRIHAGNRSGISMIEVIASTLIISTVLIVSLTASSNLMRNQAASSAGVDGKLLACRFLDEVTGQAFVDPSSTSTFGPESDESTVLRTSLDDVDDYHGLLLSPPTGRNGTTLSGYVGWSIAINVLRADTTPTGFAVTADSNAPMKQITVTCTSPSGTVTTATSMISSVSSTLDRQVAHQRQIKLSVSTVGVSDVEVVVPLRNRPSVSGL